MNDIYTYASSLKYWEPCSIYLPANHKVKPQKYSEQMYVNVKKYSLLLKKKNQIQLMEFLLALLLEFSIIARTLLEKNNHL